MDEKVNKILLPGGTHGQLPVIQEATERGLDTTFVMTCPIIPGDYLQMNIIT